MDFGSICGCFVVQIIKRPNLFHDVLKLEEKYKLILWERRSSLRKREFSCLKKKAVNFAERDK